ncbi:MULTISPECIES: hypothetical protein [Nostocaceae]|jgi:hypothetical protein|uniref:hypothetical protein n=1 Tax=Nostocaceae TaxID=1162 RepID=UPI0039C75F34
MWRVNVTCSGDAWKQYGADFKKMADQYPCECISSKKMPDETRIMAYKIEDISDAETFQENCAKYTGFITDFESL